MMDYENIESRDFNTQVENLSDLFEQDSRRYSRALTEEQEANGR